MIVHCPDCNTTTEVEETTIENVITRHNNNQHDGNEVAGIGPDAIPFSEYHTKTLDPLKVHEMGNDAGPHGNHPDGVRAICKDCHLVALFDNEIRAVDSVETHNELVHDSVDVAGICAWDVTRLPSASELLENENGLEILHSIGQSITQRQEERPRP